MYWCLGDLGPPEVQPQASPLLPLSQPPSAQSRAAPSPHFQQCYKGIWKHLLNSFSDGVAGGAGVAGTPGDNFPEGTQWAVCGWGA